MEAYEFFATPENGFIPIPEKYREKINRDIKVIVLNVWPEKAEAKLPPGGCKSDLLLPPTLDTLGWRFDREEANER